MLTLSEWLCEGIRHSLLINENQNRETANMDYLINGLLVFRLTAHKLISECGSDPTLLKHHFNSLPDGMLTNSTLGMIIIVCSDRLGARTIAATLLESMFRYLCESTVG
jgi:hypothetical protein